MSSPTSRRVWLAEKALRAGGRRSIQQEALEQVASRNWRRPGGASDLSAHVGVAVRGASQSWRSSLADGRPACRMRQPKLLKKQSDRRGDRRGGLANGPGFRSRACSKSERDKLLMMEQALGAATRGGSARSGGGGVVTPFAVPVPVCPIREPPEWIVPVPGAHGRR